MGTFQWKIYIANSTPVFTLICDRFLQNTSAYCATIIQEHFDKSIQLTTWYSLEYSLLIYSIFCTVRPSKIQHGHPWLVESAKWPVTGWNNWCWHNYRCQWTENKCQLKLNSGQHHLGKTDFHADETLLSTFVHEGCKKAQGVWEFTGLCKGLKFP